MAITINDSPFQVTPAFNPVDHTVTSTNSAQANFKYVLDLYIEGVTDPAYIRTTVNADPTTGKGHFDIQNIVRNYMTFDISKTDYGFTQAPNVYAAYTAYFGEQYGPSSGVTVTSGVTVAPQRFAFNGGFSFPAFKDYTSVTYLMVGSSAQKFLTNMPNPVTVRSDEYRWLGMMSTTANKIARCQIKTYNSAGSLLNTVLVSNTYSGVTANDDKFLNFSCGGTNLNLIPGAQIVSGSTPIITASVAKYTVQILDSGGSASSELFTFKINDECSKYTAYSFYFMNAFGRFDTFTCVLADRKEVSIKREKFKRMVGGFTGGIYTYAKSDRQEITFNTTLKDKITVNSEWIDEDHGEWLEELITSPVVYVDDATHGLLGINILQDTYQVKRRTVDKLINISFAFEYTYDRIRQQA